MLEPEQEPKSGSRVVPAAASPQEELADVIVATATRPVASIPWYVTLRPALFCLLFLVLAECAARFYFDTTLCMETQRFDNFPGPGMQDVIVAQMRRDSAYKVLLVGDSTIVGSALLPTNETMPRVLETTLNRLLPGRTIHVWNMSIAGARSTDELCMLKKALEGKPDLIIVQGNFYISDQIFDADVPLHADWMAAPWLAYNLPAVPAPIVPLLKPREWQQRVDDSVTKIVEDNIRIVGMRQAINAMLFGVQPRTPPFEAPNPMVMATVNIAKRMHRISVQPWTARGTNAASLVAQYDRPITHNNFNGQHYRDVMLELQRAGKPALTYLTPQNPAITNVVLSREVYASERHILSSFFQGFGIPHYDFSELVPDQYFVDNQHMLLQGNQRLALALAATIAPRIANHSPSTGNAAAISGKAL